MGSWGLLTRKGFQALDACIMRVPSFLRYWNLKKEQDFILFWAVTTGKLNWNAVWEWCSKIHLALQRLSSILRPRWFSVEKLAQRFYKVDASKKLCDKLSGIAMFPFPVSSTCFHSILQLFEHQTCLTRLSVGKKQFPDYCLGG